MTGSIKRLLSVLCFLALLCACLSPALADQDTTTYISVKCVDYETGEIISSQFRQVNVGWNTIEAGAAPTGYQAVASTPIRIYVDSTGHPVTDTVIFYYQKVQQAFSGIVTVYCIDINGNRIYSYTETIFNSQYIYPRAINGYTAPASPQYVYFTNGVCSPGFVIFQYRAAEPVVTAPPAVTAPPVITAPPAPVVTPAPSGGLPENVVWPTQWDTQFKPGTTGPGGYNEGRVQRLPNIADDNYMTSFDWLVWSGEKEDSIPEITAYFNNATVSKVLMRSGYLAGGSTDYYRFARPTKFRVKIFTADGGEYETEIERGDNYSTNYETFYLGNTYTNVTRIEFFLVWMRCDENEDIEHRYVIHVADMAFTS